MTKILKLVKIGNSKGVRIPQELIQRYRLTAEVQLTETEAGLLLQRSGSKKLNLEESFAEMAKNPDTKSQLEAWDATLADGLPDEDFAGWPR